VWQGRPGWPCSYTRAWRTADGLGSLHSRSSRDLFSGFACRHFPRRAGAITSRGDHQNRVSARRLNLLSVLTPWLSRVRRVGALLGPMKSEERHARWAAQNLTLHSSHVRRPASRSQFPGVFFFLGGGRGDHVRGHGLGNRPRRWKADSSFGTRRAGRRCRFRRSPVPADAKEARRPVRDGGSRLHECPSVGCAPLIADFVARRATAPVGHDRLRGVIMERDLPISCFQARSILEAADAGVDRVSPPSFRTPRARKQHGDVSDERYGRMLRL